LTQAAQSDERTPCVLYPLERSRKARDFSIVLEGK